MKKSTEQVIAMWIASAAILIFILLITGCQTLPSTDPVPRAALSSNTPIIREEPEPSPRVEVGNSTTVLVEPDPAPLMRMGEALASEPNTSITTNNSPLIRSLPNRRIIRPNCMTDEEWDKFLRSRVK